MDDNKEDNRTQKRYTKEKLREESRLKEEYGTELAPPVPWKSPTVALLEERSKIGVMTGGNPYKQEDTEVAKSSLVGYIALLTAVVSLFVWPGFLGSAAAILGVYAWMKGSKALGAWSVMIGLIAVAAYVILIPMYA